MINTKKLTEEHKKLMDFLNTRKLTFGEIVLLLTQHIEFVQFRKIRELVKSEITEGKI